MSAERHVMTEVVCPDCGKFIAPEGSADPSTLCRCADPETFAPAAFAAAAAHAPTEEQRKTCYVCGTDITNRKRLKDHLERYWCGECARADERAKRRAAELQCADCNRMFPPAKLFEHGEVKVCRACYKKRMAETEKKLIKLGHEAATRRHEMKHIKWLVIVLIVLLVLATYHQIF